MSERNRQRKVTSLDGLWEFAWLGDLDPDGVDVTALTFDEVMVVPGCFDAVPAHAGQRGLTAYRRMIALDGGAGHGRIVFHGVHHWCRVFLNGVPLRDHAGGFSRFAVDLDDAVRGTAELVVLVDNRFDADRVPLHLEYFDWYHYGGITRRVELHQLGALWIDDVRVETVEIEPPTVWVRIRYYADAPTSPDHVTGPVDITGPVNITGATRLELALDGHVLVSETLDVAPGAGTLERTLEVPGADLWSPSDPHLHRLDARLGDDDVLTRIGIRQVTVHDRQILINGEPVRLLGFNRHEAHPQFGHAVPEAVMLADIQQLRDMGCNFVRGSHYPQDPRFLELCDAHGICVWNEAIGWQHTAEHLTDDRFVESQLQHIDEMVSDAYNHPSVIMWGILNESHSHDPACRPAYAALLGRLRELDATRPVTYASNHPFDDVCMDLVDIVSVNCYPGWYGNEIEDIPAEIDRIVAHVDAAQRTKPFILSEIGAGAIYGWRDAHAARWTEPYQSRLLETVIRHLFIDRDFAAGLAIWQFCDCRTSEAVYKILGRPRGFNNKGIVDEYRRPKPAYDVVKRLFHEIGTTLPLRAVTPVGPGFPVVQVDGPAMSCAERHTKVAIEGDAFLINGELTYAGRIYRRPPSGEPRNVAGLLFNARMVQGIFDDLNPTTRTLWDYPEDAPGGAGPWDPERNTSEFVAAMPAWRAAGLLSFTINLQGGSPQGYSQHQPWHNSAFTPQGELSEGYMARLARILDAADELGMAPIVGYFYFGQDQRLVDEASVIRATDNATDWLLSQGYTHVLVEVGNEVDNRKYDHAILKADRCHELMQRVRDRSGGRLLVSTSLCGNVVPPPNLVTASDFILLHGNGVPGPDRIREMVDETRRVVGYRGQPILFNEDDHFDFAADDNHMLAALDRYAGWGYFDFRMQDEGHDEGYQSVPVNWMISSERKRGFFKLLGDMTGER